MSSEAKITLRSVADDIRSWTDTLEGLEEGTAEHEQALQEFSAAVTQGQAKVDRFAAFLRRLKAEETYLVKEADRLTQRAHAMERLEGRLRDYAIRALADANLRKINGRDSTLSLRKNRDSVDVYDKDAVPAAYKRVLTEVAVDKVRVMDAMKAGEEIPGARIKVGVDRLEES